MDNIAKTSRRLKHYMVSENYKINSNTSLSHLQELMIELVPSCIVIKLKNRLKGHTLETEVKHIEAKAHITSRDENTIYVELIIHIHHYSNLMFDAATMEAKLNNALKLTAGSVVHIVDPTLMKQTIKPTKQIIKTPFNSPVNTEPAKTKSRSFFCDNNI